MRSGIWSAIVLLLAGPAAGQPGPKAPAPPAATPDPFERALELAADGDYSGAITQLEPLVRQGDAPPPMRALLGTLYVETGSHSRALELLQPMAESEDPDPAVLYNAGRAAAALGRPDLAERFLQGSVDRIPASPAARELGLLLARQGRYFDAYKHLRSWSRIEPDDAEARQIAALCAVQLERPTEAEELLSDLPQDEPRVRLLWGKLLMQKNDAWGASATLKPMLESAPPEMQLDVRLTLADAYMAMGEAASAVEVLTGYVRGNPSTALLLALAQYQSGDLDSALATLEPYAGKLVEKAQGTDAALSGLERSLISEYGRLLATAGLHADALPLLEIASRLQPDDKLVWQHLGQALAAVGRRDEARVALQRFQEIVKTEVPDALSEVRLDKDIQDPTGRQLRAAIEAMAQGDIEKALSIALQEAQLAPQDPRPRLVEARILLVAGRLDEALEIALQLAEAAPGYADAHYILGTIRMAREEMEPAETELRRALEISPDHTAAMNDLAVLLMEKGAVEEARALLKRVLELRPGDDLATSNLERLEPPG